MENKDIKFIQVDSGLPITWKKKSMGYHVMFIGKTRAGYVGNDTNDGTYICHFEFNREFTSPSYKTKDLTIAKNSVEQAANKFFDDLQIIPKKYR